MRGDCETTSNAKSCRTLGQLYFYAKDVLGQIIFLIFVFSYDTFNGLCAVKATNIPRGHLPHSNEQGTRRSDQSYLYVCVFSIRPRLEGGPF